MSDARTRIGGHLVVDCLEAAGAQAVFGVPGIHALAIWDGLSTRDLRYIGMRTELAAGFAADGYARAGRRPGVLLTTTGPGSFVADLRADGGAHELRAARQHRLAGAARRDRQRTGASCTSCRRSRRCSRRFAKWHAVARGIDEAARPDRRGVPPGDLGAVRARSCSRSRSTCSRARPTVPAPATLDVAPVPLPAPDPALLAEAARSARRRPSDRCCGPAAACCAPARRRRSSRSPSGSDAPAATTYMGKGAIPADHPLAVGSACDEGAFQELLRTADVVLAVGTELGAETTGQWTLEFEGRLIQVDARAEHLGATYEGLGIAGDARAVLEALAPLVSQHESDGAGTRRGPCTSASRSGLASQGRDAELHLLADLRDGARPRRHPRLRHDAHRLPRRAVPRRVRARDVPLSARLRHARLRLAGRDRREGGEARRRRCSPCTATAACSTTCSSCSRRGSTGSARSCSSSTTAATGSCASTRTSAYGRTNEVDLAQPDFPALARSLGVPGLRGAAPRARRRARRGARGRRPGLHPPAPDGRVPGGDALMDLALTPELVEIQERSRRFCDEHLLPVELAVRARERPAARGARTASARRARRAAARGEHAARVGRPGLQLARAGDLAGAARALDERAVGRRLAPGERAAPLQRRAARALPAARDQGRAALRLRGHRARRRVGREQARRRARRARRAAGASTARSGSSRRPTSPTT